MFRPCEQSMTTKFRQHYAINDGERDRPGRTSRRLADWKRTARQSLNGDSFGMGQVFGETPNTATETVALPILTEALPILTELLRLSVVLLVSVIPLVVLSAA